MELYDQRVLSVPSNSVHGKPCKINLWLRRRETKNLHESFNFHEGAEGG